MFLRRVWPADHFAIMVITDEQRVPLEPIPRLIRPSETVTIAEVLTQEYRVFVGSYPTSDDVQRLQDCALSFGGAGEVVALPALAWRSGVEGADAHTEIVLSEDPDPPRFDLRVERCAPVEDPCKEIRPSTIEQPPAYDGWWHVAIGPGGVALASGLDEGSRLTLRWINLETRIIETLPMSNQVTDHTEAMIWDGVDFVGTTASGNYFRVSPGGAPNVVPAFRGGALDDLTVSPGGSTFAVQAGRVIRFTAGSSIAEPLSSQPPDFVDKIHAIRGDVVFALLRSQEVHRFDGTWTYDATFGEDVFVAMGGDGDVVALAGNYAEQFIRDPTAANWRAIPRPFDERPHDVTGAKGGRLLLTGQGGRAALWVGQQWCSIPTRVFGTLRDAAVTDDGRTAILVGGVPGGTALPDVVIVNLPAP